MEQVALVVGEALVDVVRGRDGVERDHAGGSSANAAVAMSRLGRQVWFASAWADDAHGRLLLRLARAAARIGLQAVERNADAVARDAEHLRLVALDRGDRPAHTERRSLDRVSLGEWARERHRPLDGAQRALGLFGTCGGGAETAIPVALGA